MKLRKAAAAPLLDLEDPLSESSECYSTEEEEYWQHEGLSDVPEEEEVEEEEEEEQASSCGGEEDALHSCDMDTAALNGPEQGLMNGTHNGKPTADNTGAGVAVCLEKGDHSHGTVTGEDDEEEEDDDDDDDEEGEEGAAAAAFNPFALLDGVESDDALDEATERSGAVAESQLPCADEHAVGAEASIDAPQRTRRRRQRRNRRRRRGAAAAGGAAAGAASATAAEREEEEEEKESEHEEEGMAPSQSAQRRGPEPLARPASSVAAGAPSRSMVIDDDSGPPSLCESDSEDEEAGLPGLYESEGESGSDSDAAAVTAECWLCYAPGTYVPRPAGGACRGGGGGGGRGCADAGATAPQSCARGWGEAGADAGPRPAASRGGGLSGGCGGAQDGGGADSGTAVEAAAELIAPCSVCAGGLRFIHRHCFQRWLESSWAIACPNCRTLYDSSVFESCPGSCSLHALLRDACPPGYDMRRPLPPGSAVTFCVAGALEVTMLCGGFTAVEVLRRVRALVDDIAAQGGYGGVVLRSFEVTGLVLELGQQRPWARGPWAQGLWGQDALPPPLEDEEEDEYDDDDYYGGGLTGLPSDGDESGESEGEGEGEDGRFAWRPWGPLASARPAADAAGGSNGPREPMWARIFRYEAAEEVSELEAYLRPRTAMLPAQLRHPPPPPAPPAAFEPERRAVVARLAADRAAQRAEQQRRRADLLQQQRSQQRYAPGPPVRAGGRRR